MPGKRTCVLERVPQNTEHVPQNAGRVRTQGIHWDEGDYLVDTRSGTRLMKRWVDYNKKSDPRSQFLAADLVALSNYPVLSLTELMRNDEKWATKVDGWSPERATGDLPRRSHGRTPILTHCILTHCVLCASQCTCLHRTTLPGRTNRRPTARTFSTSCFTRAGRHLRKSMRMPSTCSTSR